MIVEVLAFFTVILYIVKFNRNSICSKFVIAMRKTDHGHKAKNLEACDKNAYVHLLVG